MEALTLAVQTALSLLAALLPELGVSSNSMVEKIIGWLQGIMPTIAQLGQAAIADVQSIIASLRNGTTALTPDQMTALDTMQAQADAGFEAVAATDGYPATVAPVGSSGP